MVKPKQHKPKIESDKIHFIEFKILKGQIESPEDFDITSIKGYRNTINFLLSFNLEDNLVKADYDIDVYTNSKNTEEASGCFKLVYIFKIDNLSELAALAKDGKKVEYDNSLGNTLASICHSTTRGILLTRFQGTVLQKYILKVVNPNDLLPNKQSNDK